MANSITLFKKYTDLLDEVYKNASVTSMLDGDMSLVQMGANTNEIIIPKISMDGPCRASPITAAMAVT